MNDELDIDEFEENHNINRAMKLLGTKLLHVFRGVLTPNTRAFFVLSHMALHSYDYPPTEQQKKYYIPCRVYDGGLDTIATAMGYGLLTDEQKQYDLTTQQELIDKRKVAGRKAISRHLRFLEEHGVIKQIQPHHVGSNALYLLLLGDEEENREAEQWAMECIQHGWWKHPIYNMVTIHNDEIRTNAQSE